ncbi:hypothetical protein ROZALSC1DRAFT_25529, partial [Rozella allomycis CSF55]
MNYEINLSTPIVQVRDIEDENGKIISYLGNLKLIKENEKNLNILIQSAKVEAETFYGKKKIMKDFDVELGIEYDKEPRMYVKGNVSRVKVELDEFLYEMLLKNVFYLIDSTSEIFSDEVGEKGEGRVEGEWSDELNSKVTAGVTDQVMGSALTNTLNTLALQNLNTPDKVINEIVVELQGIELELFNLRDGKCLNFCLFKINKSVLNFKRDRGEMQVDVWVDSFSLDDTRSIKQYYTQIIPESEYSDGQLFIQYTMVENGNGMVKVTLDSPKMITSLNNIYSIKSFFLDNYPQKDNRVEMNLKGSNGAQRNTFKSNVKSNSKSQSKNNTNSVFYFLVNVVNFELFILEDLKNKETEAILIKMKQFVYSTKGNSSLSFENFGLFLLNMNEKELFKFVDEFDASLTIENDQMNQCVNYWLNTKPIVFRISYHDILLVYKIITNFIEGGVEVEGGRSSTGEGEVIGARGDTTTLNLNSATLNVNVNWIDSSELIVMSELLTWNSQGIKFLLIDDVSE